MTKTFVMCVGSQKAGTTWLWHYLQNSSGAEFAFIKELHVWDTITIPHYSLFKDNLENYIASATSDDISGKLRQLELIDNPSRYFSYFTYKLVGQQITGDFTPQYSALSADTYNHIISNFAQRNVETKAIFLMRDPVDRLQSMMRMKCYQQGNSSPSYQDELDSMVEHSQSLNYYYTGDYSTIVPKLDDVFKSNIHYTFYDELFEDKSIQLICEFLNIPFHKPDYDFNPMYSKTSNILTPTDRQYFEHLYKHIYDYTAERFPEVRKLWTYYQK